MTDWTDFALKAALWAGVILLAAWATGTLFAWLFTKFVIM